MSCTISPKQFCRSMLVGLFTLLGTSVSLLAVQALPKEDVPDWIRGRGEQLELRLSGRITRSDGGSTDNAEVQIEIKYNDRVFEISEPKVEGGRFQAWLPVNKYQWDRIIVRATCRDGARSTKTIQRQQLRKLVVHGLNLEVQLPNRQIEVRVNHAGSQVANATVRAELSSGAVLRSVTKVNGKAKFSLLGGEELVQLTAWSGEPLIGGYQLSSKPVRNSKADFHDISMHRCRPFEVHLKDPTGQPIVGVELGFQVSTPPPDYNYLGTPDDYKLVTDQHGIATVARFPDIEDAHFYAEVSDQRWVIESSQRGEDKLEVVAKRAVERAKMTGHVSGGGKFAGGFSIKLGSFEAEQDGRIDFLYGFSDADGRFIADVLPDATYAVFLEDDKWVANAVDLIPFHSKTGQRNFAELFLSEGIPVRISLTQGSNYGPIPGAWVNIDTDHRFSWFEDGKKRSGSLGRNGSIHANEEGVIEILAPEGELEASIYLSDWRASQSIDVRRGERNEIELHRKVTEAVEVTGRIVPWKEDQHQIAGATVHIKAIDGESGDEFRLKSDENGSFRFKTKATKLGVIAYSPDKRFIGTLVIKELSKPVRIQLHPAKSFAGQITDQDRNPIADHRVWAFIQIKDEREFGTTALTNFYLPKIEIQTDSEGNYRFDGLPCKTKILLRTDTLGNEPNYFEYVDEVYYLPDDDIRRRTTKIGATKSRNVPLPLTQRFASMHRDCGLGNYHLMVIVHDRSKESSKEFINRHLLNYPEHKAVASYMQLHIDVKELSEENNKAFVERLDWPKVTKGVFACAYDVEGKELGRIRIAPEASDSAETAYEFIERHMPVQQDAEAQWNKVFQQANEQNKLVWVRTGQRYCGPCFMLSRWIDDHREVLEKDFILIKIDDVRDLKGQEVAERLTKGRSVGVPFYAMFDVQENIVIDSYGPLGNIGFMSGLEGKRHFKKMLDAACSNISPQEIQALLDTLKD